MEERFVLLAQGGWRCTHRVSLGRVGVEER